MSNPVEKTPAQKKIKVRGSVLRLVEGLTDKRLLQDYASVRTLDSCNGE